MADLVYCLSLLFFDIPLLHYCFSLRSSIIFYLFSRDIYFSLGISLSSSMFSLSLSTTSDILGWSIFKTFLILSAIVLSIKSPIASVYFCIALFEAVISASVTDCLAWSRSVWVYFPLQFLHIFLAMLFLLFLSLAWTE